MLKLELACRVLEFFLVSVLLHLSELESLVPDLVDKAHELAVVGNFTERVRHVCEEVVEVELPVLVLVLDAVLKDTLVVVARDEHFAVLKDVD